MGNSSAPHLSDPDALDEPIDWGIVPTMIEGASHTSGVLLHIGVEWRVRVWGMDLYPGVLGVQCRKPTSSVTFSRAVAPTPMNRAK